jgi:hypothetical protein
MNKSFHKQKHCNVLIISVLLGGGTDCKSFIYNHL